MMVGQQWTCWWWLIFRWLGSVVVGRWTRDQEVAGSTPTAALFGQQPWASYSHLMCLCSPSSITWYLARAFMLKAPYCWQRHRANEQGGRPIVERFCGDSRIAKNHDINHPLYLLLFCRHRRGVCVTLLEVYNGSHKLSYRVTLATTLLALVTL